MARPTKSAAVLSQYSQTKDEIRQRVEGEEKLKGGDAPPPPERLKEKQKEIYLRIVECLRESGMLCLNDEWILSKTAIAIERLETIERLINENEENLKDRELLAAQKIYTGDFYRGCNELCLSPQSRAKMANADVGKEEFEPLKGLLEMAGGAKG